jgi:hypothetical protein
LYIIVCGFGMEKKALLEINKDIESTLGFTYFANQKEIDLYVYVCLSERLYSESN